MIYPSLCPLLLIIFFFAGPWHNPSLSFIDQALDWLIDWLLDWSRSSYMHQHCPLSSQPRFITGPSFLKCKILAIKCFLIITLPHLPQNILFSVIPMIHLKAISDNFLHDFYSPIVLENQLDLRICLPPSLLWLFGSGQAEGLCVHGFILCTRLIWMKPRPFMLTLPFLSSCCLLSCVFLFPDNTFACWQSCNSMGFQRDGFCFSPTISTKHSQLIAKTSPFFFSRPQKKTKQWRGT